MYEEGDGWGPAGELDAMKAYVIEAMMWDPTQEPDVLIAEFLAAYYGGAAVYIEQYMQTMHQALVETNYTRAQCSGCDRTLRSRSCIGIHDVV
jgi:hypothetical protein